jgi:hypothetical protein
MKRNPLPGPFIAALLAWAVLPSGAQIFVENEFADQLPDQAAEQDFENVPYKIQFDAGEFADKLIVTLSSEGGNIATITYDGNALTQIPNTANSRNRGIWYLDLPGTGYAGGDADLTFDLTANDGVNGIGIGVVAISDSVPGYAASSVASGTSVSIDPPVADSFVVTNYGANGSAAVTEPLDHILLYTGDIGSARGGTSYAEGLAAGSQMLTWGGSVSGGDTPRTSAAVFIPASAAPVIVALNPADDATNVPVDTNLVATFSEPVVAGTAGNIELWQVGGGSALETFDVTSSTQLTFDGSQLTIDPASDLAPNVEHYVLIDSGAVVDTSGGDSFTGIADTTAWSFTADIPPAIATLVPADDATDVVVSSNLVATFSEPVQAGTGNIELWQVGGGSALETFDVASSSQLTFDGASLTIDPTDDLDTGVDYYVLIDSTAVEDTTGNTFAGISDTTAWSFSTDGTAPTIDILVPADDATEALVTSNLTAIFGEPVMAGTGNIELWQVGGGSALETFDVSSSSRVVFDGAVLTVDPTSDLDPATDYYVTIADTAVEDLSGNVFAGLSGDAAWNFTTTATIIPIITVNTGSMIDASQAETDYTLSFDPGNNATALVVAVVSESNASAGQVAVSFDGVPLVAAYEFTASNAGVYYLNNPSIGGPLDLTVDFSAVGNMNGVGFAVASLAASGPIEPTAVATSTGNPGALDVTLPVPSAESFVMAGFNANGGAATASSNSPLVQLLGADLGSLGGTVGYQNEVPSGDQAYSFATTGGTPRFSIAVAFNVEAGEENKYSDWIAGYPGVGAETALDDDPDGDGNDNGVENFFGTKPDEFSQGLVSGAADPGAGTFTFTHPQNASPADDLTAAYRWSKDLAGFLADGATDGAGTKVDFTTQPDTPSAGITTVTATVTGTATDMLFVDVEVLQN